LQIKTRIVSCHTADSKPVKQEVNRTVLLLLLVFPGHPYSKIYQEIFLVYTQGSLLMFTLLFELSSFAVCLFVNGICPYAALPTIHLSVSLYVYTFICMSFHLSIHLSVNLYVSPMSICLSIFTMSGYLFVRSCLLICLSLCMFTFVGELQ
jgi:hypothetical protein